MIFTVKPEGHGTSLQIIAPSKEHDLYFTVWLSRPPTQGSLQCLQPAFQLEKLVNEVVSKEMRNADIEVLAGVGFGPNLYPLFGQERLENFNYRYRRGDLGEMPATGKDYAVFSVKDESSSLEF